MMDYDGDASDSIRFGDGVFGDIPEDETVFAATYRTGGGAAGNVPADSITRIEVPTGLLLSVNNPLPATGGADPESAQTVRRLAPQAFRATQFRAVIQKDYEAAAETLPWVQRAGTVFRWTGSWLTVFTTADPIGSEHIPVEQHVELVELLNRYRLAGYESYTPDPIYAALDLIVTVCAQPESFRGDVEAAVLRALSTARFADGTTGFFQFDNFTFGQPLERSALEAAIQEAHGVAGVLCIRFRRRGFTPGFVPMPDTVNVAVNEIILVENDPSRPERGSILVIVNGGK
jgi:predicted phage baseplate assembly protein